MKKSHSLRLLGSCMIVLFPTYLFAQKEFFYAREFQLISNEEIIAYDKLIKPKGGLTLSEQEQKDWQGMKDFIKNPLDYIKQSDPAVFDPLVINKLKQASTAQRELSLVDKGGVGDSQGEYPGAVLPIAEITSNLIYATGQLLLDRAKQELYNAHFQQVKTVFEEEREFGPANQKKKFSIKDLLPNSYLIISNFNALTQPQIGKSLQKAFEQDLKEFYKNSMKHLLHDDFKKEWPYLFLEASFSAIEQLNQGSHPSAVLKELSWRYRSFEKKNNTLTKKGQMALALNTLNMISESLIDRQETATSLTKARPYWINKKAFSDLAINGYGYYVCLLYLNHQGIFKELGLTPDRIADRKSADYGKFKELITEILSKIEWVESKLDQLKSASKEKDNLDVFGEYSNAVISLIDLIRPIVCDFATVKTLCDDDYNVLKPQVELALTIPSDIKRKDYASSFLKSYRISKTIYQKYSSSKNDFADNAEIIRYLTLANDIVQADSVEDMKRILDAAILPVGSFMQKRTLNYTTTINGYVGINGGLETILSSQFDYKTGGQIGPFAPIGIDFSWASKNNHSNGIFFALIDLGAIVNMYFAGNDMAMVMDETGSEMEEEVEFETLPELKFKNIFAPGLFYVHGWKKSPISTGLGVQLAPDLREISIENGANIATEGAIRFSAFLAVDIPLFNIARGGRRVDIEE